MMEVNKIYNLNCNDGLLLLGNNSIDCCITSPPYWGLRDYGVVGQLGLEKTPEEYVLNLIKVLTEVKRVLKPSGTLWLNLGDSYAGSGKGIGSNHGKSVISDENIKKTDWKNLSFKPKDLIGIPWMVAFALRADGWYLRQDIIWNKPNPMPESMSDRCTKAHEYIFLLTKNRKYYFDNEAIKTPSKDPNDDRGSRKNRKRFPTTMVNGIRKSGTYEMANKRSVWTVNTKPYKEAHFATFPEDLIIDCIKAGCPENGIVLDPFMGAGTTAVVAKKLNRNFIGFELNNQYVEISEKRLINN